MIAFFFCYQRLLLASVFLVGLLSRGGLAQSRKEHKDLFVYGEFEFIDLESQDFLAYRKKNDVSEATVIVNLSKNAGESPVEASRDSSLLM
jgi:glycosidase